MEIGGYFELELPYGEEYYPDAIKLNSGRNAFEYILRVKEYQKVYLPYFTGDAMLEPIQKLNIEFEFYEIGKTFKPVNFDFAKLKEAEVFVYTNYFGICDKQVMEISKICKNLIIDNSQAFFSKPIEGVDTFYSPRKFFGVPDGAYLYTDKILDRNWERDISHMRCEHLLGRTDTGAAAHYQSFRTNNISLCNQPIKRMSRLTQRLLCSIDYDTIAKKRKANFQFLHKHLKSSNELNIQLSIGEVPMVYPYLPNSYIDLKQKLIANMVFVATYWPNKTIQTVKNSWANHLLNNLINFPIDQRYNRVNMQQMLDLL